jgi:hypothetical protein
MAAAKAAILAELEPLGRLLPVFERVVVPSPALGAGHHYHHAIFFFRHSFDPGGREAPDIKKRDFRPVPVSEDTTVRSRGQGASGPSTGPFVREAQRKEGLLFQPCSHSSGLVIACLRLFGQRSPKWTLGPRADPDSQPAAVPERSPESGISAALGARKIGHPGDVGVLVHQLDGRRSVRERLVRRRSRQHWSIVRAPGSRRNGTSHRSTDGAADRWDRCSSSSGPTARSLSATKAATSTASRSQAARRPRSRKSTTPPVAETAAPSTAEVTWSLNAVTGGIFLYTMATSPGGIWFVTNPFESLGTSV